MLFLFVSYYLRMGWKVILYDRFGLHRDFIADLLSSPALDYHPYTVFQLSNPDVYNEVYRSKLTFEDRYFYMKEKNAGYKGTQADTSNQDHDKSRTYDLCRVEYAHMDLILFVDSDELFYCPLPQGQSTQRSQKKFQQRLLGDFVSRGIDEMRFVRLPYSGKMPKNITDLASFDVDIVTRECMLRGFETRSIDAMMSCWSTATSFDNYPKSADLGSVCPFHYNVLVLFN